MTTLYYGLDWIWITPHAVQRNHVYAADDCTARYVLVPSNDCTVQIYTAQGFIYLAYVLSNSNTVHSFDGRSVILYDYQPA